MLIRRSLVALVVGMVGIAVAGCGPKQPPAAVAPAPLDDSSAAALRWVDANARPISALDTTASRAARAPFVAVVGDARVVGVSELTEGTHEFPTLVHGMLRALAEDAGFRGLAVQAPMDFAMDLDRYVRTGHGDSRRLLRALGEHWDTREMQSLVEWVRAYDASRPDSARVGVYGFELPSAAHAVQVVTSLPDSVAGKTLNAWLKHELECIAMNEGANFGKEGRAADSSFWNRCRTVTAQVADSLAALRARRSADTRDGDLAFAQQMAGLLQHHMTVGLKHLPRHEAVAEHVLWLANRLGADGKLLVWGRDVESGRLTLPPNTIQSAVPISKALGERYRNLAFTAGEGTVRAKPLRQGQEPGGETNMTLAPPTPRSYEDVLRRARLDGFIDMRALPSDTAGKWLAGPRPMRLVSGVYLPQLAREFQTELRFPENYDVVLFERRVTPAARLKH